MSSLSLISYNLACNQPKCRSDKGVLEIKEDDIVFRFKVYHGPKPHWQGLSLKRTIKRAVDNDPTFLSRLVSGLK